MAKRKVLYIGLALLAVLIIAGVAIYSLLFVTKTAQAMLLPQGGVVEVNSGSGFVAVNGETQVSEDDIIRTGADGSASLVLYESLFITLEPNTQVSVSEIAKDNIQIEQSQGSTWNKFTKINGVTGYTVTTPTSVAAVRGTEFGISDSRLIVAEGTVELEAAGKKMSVTGDEKADITSFGATKKTMDQEDRKYMISRLEIQMKQLKQMRSKMLAEHKLIVDKMLTAQNAHGEKYSMEELLDAADEDRVDLANARESIDLKAEWIDNVFQLTEKIKEQSAHIARLKAQK